MSRTRRNFSAKFKCELVIELLKGEKRLKYNRNRNNIQPNLLRNWKNGSSIKHPWFLMTHERII